jgi:hypothetical protein
MSGGHDGGHDEGHSAHLDRAGAADMMAPFNPVSNTLGTLLAMKNYKRISKQENGIRCVVRLCCGASPTSQCSYKTLRWPTSLKVAEIMRFKVWQIHFLLCVISRLNSMPSNMFAPASVVN